MYCDDKVMYNAFDPTSAYFTDGVFWKKSVPFNKTCECV